MTVIYTAQNEAPDKKPRNALLPLLVVLFVISYSILTLLVIEQGRTIEVQRGLLREMLKDSTQLATLKKQIAQEAAARKTSPADRKDGSSANSSDSPARNDAPKASGKDTKRQGKSRTMKEVPETPAADLQDVRRSTRVI
ncbi:MAG TPA: hypothetical protein VLT90_16130 [Terriglobales bacterium]|nr:hypothetical protein [Terriglobales bacterium]